MSETRAHLWNVLRLLTDVAEAVASEVGASVGDHKRELASASNTNDKIIAI